MISKTKAISSLDGTIEASEKQNQGEGNANYATRLQHAEVHKAVPIEYYGSCRRLKCDHSMKNI